MNQILEYLRGLPRRQLVREIRRAAEDNSILLWEFVSYGDMYAPCSAGPQTAARLGVKVGTIIGYKLLTDAPMGSAIGDLMHAVRQDDPPYPDPFR